MRKKRLSETGRDDQELLAFQETLVLGPRWFWTQSGQEKAVDRAMSPRKLDAAAAAIMFGAIVEHVLLVLAAVWLRWYWLFGLLAAGDVLAALGCLKLNLETARTPTRKTAAAITDGTRDPDVLFQTVSGEHQNDLFLRLRKNQDYKDREQAGSSDVSYPIP